jgi:hypothetical protein
LRGLHQFDSIAIQIVDLVRDPTEQITKSLSLPPCDNLSFGLLKTGIRRTITRRTDSEGIQEPSVLNLLATMTGKLIHRISPLKVSAGVSTSYFSMG